MMRADGRAAFGWVRAWVLAGAVFAGVACGWSQTTNVWVLNANGTWTTLANWDPNTNYPDSVGAVAFLTNNVNGNRILTLDTNVTLGTLVWGDWDRGNQIDIRTNAAGARLTFDTGDDGRMALLGHASGDAANRDIGNDSDDTDVGITVADAQGLYFDTFRNLVFNGRGAASAAFDGGGHDVVKAEDGTVFMRRIVTNINTLYVRDGEFRIDPEGDPALLPSISTVVVGVASGVIDLGEMHPDGYRTNTNEGVTGVNRDRRQFPVFGLIGAASTNTAVAMTNGFEVVINRGMFRSYNRPAWTNGAVSAFYSGNFQLNGTADETIFNIESEGNTATNSVLSHVMLGRLTGSGGLTKWGNGQLVLVNSNDFAGDLNINRANDRRRGNAGGVHLEGQGTLSGVGTVHLQRDGSLFLDNSGVNLSNRVNDSAAIVGWGRSQIELVGRAGEDSYERWGATTVTNGRLAIEFDADDASPGAQVLELGSLHRARGTIAGFHVSDLFQGALATNGPGSVTVNLLDGGASLAQVGGTGASTTDVKVAVGVFGGDGVDSGVDKATQTPSRADEFMTVDGGRLRTLRAEEMVHLGAGSTGALQISQASAGVADNVNISFGSRFIAFGQGDYTNGSNERIDKVVTGDATFNAIRLGVVRGPASGSDNPNDLGRSLLINDGVRLTSESGMLLMGRDTTSADGDTTPGGNVLIYNGILDLDGTNNDREAIIQNDSGNSLFIRTRLEATQGLTKGGQQNVYLDVANQLGGTVSIAQASLVVRNGRALDGASDVRLGGDGVLVLEGGGVAIANVTLTSNPQAFGTRVIYNASGHNEWGGDIGIQNVDNQGLTAHDSRLGAGINSQNSVLTLSGDIGRVDSGMTSDVFYFDPPQVSTVESAGILNLKGTFGDRLVNGEALPVDVTGTGQSRVSGGFNSNRAANENDVLRFRIDGPSLANFGDELVVNIYRPWNSAGRIDAQQGTIRWVGDPSLGQGEFWTSNAMAVADFGNGFSGFRLGGTGTDRNGSVTFLLTKDGQVFNAKNWSVDQANDADNTVTMGLEHVGPSNVTVTIGSQVNDPNPTGGDNRITFSGASASLPREFRLFSHDGYDSAIGSNTVGTVNVIQSLAGYDNGILTKVGSGTVALQGGTNLNSDEGNEIRRFMLLGGELVLDRRSGQGWDTGLRRTQNTAGRGILETSGGDLTHLGANGNTTEWIQSNLVVRAGDSTISSVAGTSGTTELFLATANGASLTRSAGGTIHFVEDNALNGGAGTANIRFGGVGGSARIGSWATYATNYGAGAYTWAATDASSNIVEFGEGGYSVDSFGGANHVHLEVPSALAADDAAASLRYTNAATLDLGGFTLDVVEGGILVTPTVGGTASIDNGQLTSSGGELIIHNYHGAGGGFAISAAITGAVDVTFSGNANGTTLSGNNTYTGVTRINGGTVTIDTASRLGSGAADLELRGGVLATTASTFLSNRTVILGGDGGTFRVAAGTTNTLGRVESEANILDAGRVNNGHGDLVKTGEGMLQLTYSIANERTEAQNTYEGLTDIREGTLRVIADNHFALGTAKSFYDGTVVRDGATLEFGNSPAGTTYNIYEWLTLEQGSTLRIMDPAAGYQAPDIDGVINFAGDATVFIAANEADFNPEAGYLMGSGALIKDGNSGLRLYGYSPEYTGQIIIKDGYLEDLGYASSSIPNASGITIGLNDTTNRGTLGFLMRGVERNGTATEFDINQDIVVQGNSDTTRLGTRRSQHNDVVNFNGDIDMSNFNANRDLQIYFERDISNRDASGGDEWREESFVNFTGDISGGSRRLRTVIDQVGGPYANGTWTQSVEAVDGVQPTNEPNFMVFWTFSGSNTDWTGSLEMGNRNTADQDKQHFVRFGNNDGAASYAIGASNQVVMRHNAILQAHGSHVTIGNLYGDGNSGGSDGFWGSQQVTNTFLENGGTVAGSFTIVQTTNRAFSGVVRDGTYHSPTTTNLGAAALSLIKDGPGILALTESNYYTGTTTIRGGTLAVDGIHAGGSGPYSVLDGGLLGGTGIVMASVQAVGSGGLAPGSIDRFGATMYGSLTINGNLTLSNASVLQFDLDGNDITPGGDPLTLNDLVHVTGNLVLDGVLEITPSVAFMGPYNTNTDFWTLFTYEGTLTDNGLEIDPATQALVSGDGYYFYAYNYEGGAIDEIRLGIAIPEPSTWILLFLGLGIVGSAIRRARRS